MFDPTCRRAILLPTILLATMAPRPAAAQNPVGAAVDIVFLKTRQWKLGHDRARLQADIDRGDSTAVARDLRRVRRDEVAIEVDRWLLRGDLFLPLAFTTSPQPIPRVPPNPAPIPHPQYPGYGYFPSDPDHLYRLPQPAYSANAQASGGASAPPAPAPAAPVAIEIVNAGRPGVFVDYVVDGVAYKIEGGRRQQLAVGPASTIAYDRGGGLDPRRYSLSAGVYEFRPGDSGWDFFKIRRTP
jgi:hypothetical protein